MKSWEIYFIGINYIVDQYGIGKKMRYPAIDSASFFIKGDKYQQMLKSMFVKLKSQLNAAVFYENPLKVAMQLMRINHRDEPARHELLINGENKAAYHIIKSTNFDNYTYSSFVVPGNGPRSYDVRLDPASIERCKIVADRYSKKIAPFIILTGGYCHPFQTKYAESVEMKKYLVDSLHVPADIIIIDPHARHTTTNFRNPSRYIIRYGLPQDKPALFVTSKGHADYIMDAEFDKRNMDELGYLPYKNKTSISSNELSFYPVIESLHCDPTDPLDP